MFDTEAEAAALGMYVARNENAIVNALQLHAERMTAAAEDARVQYEQGQADPAVRKAQDATLISNNGYQQFADLYTREAESSRRIIAEIQRMLDNTGDEDEVSDDEASDGELHTRVIASPDHPGTWQAQYHDAETDTWIATGDPQADKADAEAREADYRRAMLRGQPEGFDYTDAEEGVRA